MSKFSMHTLSKDQALILASRREGFSVDIYAWSHDKVRKQFQRYFDEGLLTRDRIRLGKRRLLLYRLKRDIDLL